MVAVSFLKGLGHEPCLQAHVLVAHLPLDLRSRHQGGHRVDDEHVDAAASHQDLGNVERLLSGVRLGHEEVVHVHSQSPGIAYVQGVLRVDEGDHTAGSLGLGCHVKGQRGLARRLRAVDLHDPSPGDSADPEGQVQGQGTGGNGRDIQHLVLAHLHDGAPAELLLDLRDGLLYRPLPVLLLCHARSSERNA